MLQGKRAALPSASIMLRQPLQRFTQMQATDIDIYRKELRRSKINMVRSRPAVMCCIDWPQQSGSLPAHCLEIRCHITPSFITLRGLCPALLQLLPD